MKETVLVSGGAGYIGTHTTVELIEAGYDVVIVDNLSNSKMEAVEGVRKITGVNVPFEQVDCTDKEALGRVFDQYKFNSIIHFAASKAVGESVEKPLLYYRNNLQTPRQPATSPYGNTKQICEDILRDTVHAYPELFGIALRYFNPIGAHPSALIGELPKGVPMNLVPFITQTAAGIRECLSVFGDDYDTPDGSAIRDYIDVNDLARAHVVAVDRMVGGKSKSNYEYFNIGTGRGLSVLELIAEFEKATGVKLNYKIVGRRAGDIEKIWADTTYANKELGWSAKRSTGETLLSAWNWEKKIRGIK